MTSGVQRQCEQWAIEQMAAGDRRAGHARRSTARGRGLNRPRSPRASPRRTRRADRGCPPIPGRRCPTCRSSIRITTPFRLARYSKATCCSSRFSFTRCPLSRLLPADDEALSAAIEKATAHDASRPLKNARLLTVTIDPAYDTPARRELRRQARHRRWPGQALLALDASLPGR